MSKIVIDLGWRKYVVNTDEAVKLAAMLSTAELYESKYTKDEKGEGVVMHHIYPQDDMRWHMDIMPDSVYRMAKLAGKPTQD
jgi:hypothetical protein